MDKITAGKTLVGSTKKALNNAKKTGKFCPKEIFMLEIMLDLRNSCHLEPTFEAARCLDAQIRKMVAKYPSICIYKEPNTNVVSIRGKKCQNSNSIYTNNPSPLVEDYDCYNYEFETFYFTTAMFESVYTDNDDLAYLRIKTLPSTGTLKLNTTNVVVNQIIPVANIQYLNYNYGSLVSVGEDITFTFQLSDGTLNHTFSNIATYTICVPEQENEPPTIDNLSLNIDESGDYIFTYNDLTVGINYQDREGDNPENLKIISLPDNGTLYYNDIEVMEDDIIPYSDISLGLFKFTPDDEDESYTIEFDIVVSDEGSGQYSS